MFSSYHPVLDRGAIPTARPLACDCQALQLCRATSSLLCLWFCLSTFLPPPPHDGRSDFHFRLPRHAASAALVRAACRSAGRFDFMGTVKYLRESFFTIFCVRPSSLNMPSSRLMGLEATVHDSLHPLGTERHLAT